MRQKYVEDLAKSIEYIICSNPAVDIGECKTKWKIERKTVRMSVYEREREWIGYYASINIAYRVYPDVVYAYKLYMYVVTVDAYDKIDSTYRPWITQTHM